MKKKLAEQQQIEKTEELSLFIPSDSPSLKDKPALLHPVAAEESKNNTSWWMFSSLSPQTVTSPSSRPMSPLSPRRKKLAQIKKQGSEILENVVYIVTSPVPYLVLILLVAMVRACSRPHSCLMS
jgi:hypothetical protein